MPREETITDNIEEFLQVLPERVREKLSNHPRLNDLFEVVIDLGRPIEARFPDGYELIDGEATQEDIAYVASRVGHFDRDNRAGIERTLHRISCIRNRFDEIVGLTCRVGRAVYGTIDIIRDIIETGRSILLLGRPGVGKTTKLREAARVLADELQKRVIVVDTNNEIAGDGDIPHPAIGRARRMQVPQDRGQCEVMIEAVENHMPEVIIIDEISDERDAFAARTIAERGVQLIATAHGNTLENIMSNPTLADLIGGIQAVTLSDEEARKRGTQKTVLERKAPPTFDTVVEIEDIDRLVIHQLLLGRPVTVEVREKTPDGTVRRSQRVVELVGSSWSGRGEEFGEPQYLTAEAREEEGAVRVYADGLSTRKLERALRELRAPAVIVGDPREADIVVTLVGHERRSVANARPGARVLTVRSNTYGQIYEALREAFDTATTPRERYALQEAEMAIAQVLQHGQPVELTPQNAYIRRLQHELIARHNLRSESVGKEPRRRVRVLPF
ncbi:MAG: single-stranded DNA-binding protein [Armatimonadetes bacterium]|nr:single-stranded DNA-binding protein [Armatimonadota bacterium]